MQLKLSAQKIWYYSEAIDFRKSIDGLVGFIQMHLNINPTDGIYIFHNRQKDKLKILAWHGNGFVLLYKRIESGKFTPPSNLEAVSVTLDEKQLSWLLAGLDWDKMTHWNTLEYNDYC